MNDFAGGVHPLLDAISYVLEREPYASYNTVEAIETGEPGLAGQSSIAVSKLDGRVRRPWSGRPIEAQL